MKEEITYILTFLMAMVLTIIIHYNVFSKIDMHPTLHVTISLIILWLFLSGVVLIVERIKKYQNPENLEAISSQ